MLLRQKHITDSNKTYFGLHAKCPVFLSDLHWTLRFSTEDPEDLQLQKNLRRIRNILHGMSLLYSSGRNVKRGGVAKAAGLLKLSVTTERLLIVWSGGKCGKRTRECQVIAGRGDPPENSVLKNLLVAQNKQTYFR
jgi:hypothetical protein